MQFDRPSDTKKEPRFGIHEAMNTVRRALGTYSNVSFYSDLRAIAADYTVPEHTRTVAEKYLQNARKYALTPAIADAIIARRLPRAPEGYMAVEEFRLSEHLGIERVNNGIRHCLGTRGVPETVLTDRAQWERHKLAIGNFCIHARGGNGIATVFFSPEAQQEILSTIGRGSRQVHEVHPEQTHPPAPISNIPPHAIEIMPSPSTPEHDIQIERLRARLSTILLDLYRDDRQEARAILEHLTKETGPHDAQYYALRIAELETIAARNTRED